MYLDEETHRLVGTTKLMKYLDGNSSKLKVGAGVELIMWHATSLGYTAIIDGSMVGLVYQDDIYEEIWPGDIKHGFIKRVREDGKIDLSLRPFGYNKVTDESQKILDYLEKHGGTMVFTDKSNPERISRTFRMSKKVFKKALGLLYKQKLVVLDKGSTRLASLEAPKKAKEAPEKNWEAPKKSVEAPKKAKEEIEKNWEAPKKTIEGPIELIDAPKKNERPIWPED